MIRVGIGGWSFDEWRGPFYPKGTLQKDELGYASRHVTTIEINGTFYRTQSPASFQKWYSETPADFIFSVKAPRYCVNRKVLSEGGALIDGFLKSGVGELKEKLGPILWQLAPTKKFDAQDIQGFFELLPRKLGTQELRHAIEVRHESFAIPEFVALARKAEAAIVYADSDKYPAIADLTADFVYARLQRCALSEPAGYAKTALDKWAGIAKEWANGGAPKALNTVESISTAKRKRDVFLYFIAGAKVRAPAAAMAMIERLK